MRVGPKGGAGAATAAPALAGALLVGAVFFGGGSSAEGLAWLGAAALLSAGGLGALALTGVLAVPLPGRSGAALIVAFAGLVAWSGLSIAWSVAPDRSAEWLGRGLAYAAFLGLGLLVGGRGVRAAAALLAAVAGAALVWALLGKVVPALGPADYVSARLRGAVGYWNALALLADAALVLGVWLAARAAHPRVARAAGAVLVFLTVLALALTASRTGIVAAVAALALWLALERERVEAAVVLVLGGLPAAAVGAWALTRPALVDADAARADRVADGTVLGVLVLAGGALVAAAAWRLTGRACVPAARARVGRVLAVSAAAGAAVALAVLVVVVGNPVGWAVDEFRGESAAPDDPGRLASLSSNNRAAWWGEAWAIFRDDPVAGAGANTFAIARLRHRDDALNAAQPHSVPLQQLADGGLVGLTLFAAVVAAAAAVCVCARRRLAGDERAAATALTAFALAWLVHALADYPLDFAAVTAPALFAVGAVATAGRAAGARRSRRLAAAAVALVALAAVPVLLAPRLAAREVETAYAAADRGDGASAVDHAERARMLDPFALEPYYAEAEATGSRAPLRRAAELQPENPEPWVRLGNAEFAAGNLCEAYAALNEAYTRDPYGVVRGGLLDQARAFVDENGCG